MCPLRPERTRVGNRDRDLDAPGADVNELNVLTTHDQASGAWSRDDVVPTKTVVPHEFRNSADGPRRSRDVSRAAAIETLPGKK